MFITFILKKTTPWKFKVLLKVTKSKQIIIYIKHHLIEDIEDLIINWIDLSHLDYNLQHDLMLFAGWTHSFLGNFSKNTQGSLAHVTLLSPQSTSQQSNFSLTLYFSQQSCNCVATKKRYFSSMWKQRG